MSRIRSLHPGQWTDEDFVGCSMAARLLALGLRNEADDNGVFEWKPIAIKMRLFPADNVEVAALLDELSANRQVASFEHSGRRYGVIRNFRRWQRPDKPKSWHPLPDDMRAYVGLVDDRAPTATRPVADQSPNSSAEVGCRRKEEGGKAAAAADPVSARDPEPPAPPPAPAPPQPPTDVDQRHALGLRVLEAARIDPARWTGTWGLITAWLAAGYDPELDILPAVRAVAAREGYEPARSLKYFTAAIESAWRERSLDIPASLRRPSPAAPTPPTSLRQRRYDRAITRWIDNGCKGREPLLEDFDDKPLPAPTEAA